MRKSDAGGISGGGSLAFSGTSVWLPVAGDIVDYHQPLRFGGGVVAVKVIKLRGASVQVDSDGRTLNADLFHLRRRHA